jgi:hypothetical protein
MKIVFLLNYYIHWVGLLAIVVGLLGEVFSDTFKKILNFRDMSLFSLAAFGHLFIYQLLASVFAVVKSRRNSIFFSHFVGLIIYLILYTIYVLFIMETLMDYLENYTIPLAIVLLPSLFFVLRYWKITHTELNFYKLHNHETSQ